MQTVLYFDICALPIFFIILLTVIIRKMTQGITNKLFIALVLLSAATTVADLAMELALRSLPADDLRVAIASASMYVYFMTESLAMFGYYLFAFAVTGTWYRIRGVRKIAAMFLPYLPIPALLIINPFTGAVFTVTAEDGYSRGWLIWIVYAITMVYAGLATVYFISCRRYMSKEKLFSLMSLSVLIVASVVFQFFFPQYLVEMIATAFSFILIILFVMRPEELADASVGTFSYDAYRADLKKILEMNRKVQIVAVNFLNAGQLYVYLGEEHYLAYVSQIIRQIEAIFRKEHVYADIYFEQPGNIYVVLDDMSFDIEDCVKRMYGDIVRKSEKAIASGERVAPRVCCISVPDDLSDFDEIIRLGREFGTQVSDGRLYSKASELIASRDYGIMSHMDTILNRAISENRFRMYYQPIYSFERGKFISAEALIRLVDDDYGFVPPGLFIPAAERKGVILPIGDFVLEDVHRFISENDFGRLGLEYIEINLSVLQCMQEELPEKMAFLGEKYGVSPDKVNLEITETTYEEAGVSVMDNNLEMLSGMGYTFSLDDFGTGYSNMQRVSRLPLKMIKLDKSLVDDMESEDGLMIMRNTVKMMRDIDKELVAEGVETKENLERLEALGCHFIQGYYFSKPLPEQEFIEFITKHNKVTA